MPSEIVVGLSFLQKRLSSPDWAERPAGSFLKDWRDDLRREAISRAPDWRGGIIRSLRSLQDTAKFPLWARVFADAPEARWTELGTGLLSEDPQSAHRRYFPNVTAITPYAEDHGINPWAMAKGTYNRGGTPPQHWFRDAERAADASFNHRLKRFAGMIERAASAGSN